MEWWLILLLVVVVLAVVALIRSRFSRENYIDRARSRIQLTDAILREIDRKSAQGQLTERVLHDYETRLIRLVSGQQSERVPNPLLTDHRDKYAKLMHFQYLKVRDLRTTGGENLEEIEEALDAFYQQTQQEMMATHQLAKRMGMPETSEPWQRSTFHGGRIGTSTSKGDGGRPLTTGTGVGTHADNPGEDDREEEPYHQPELAPRGTRFCPWCGAPVRAGGPYCSACGRNVAGTAPPTLGARAKAGGKKVSRVIGKGILALIALLVVAFFYAADLRSETSWIRGLFGSGPAAAQCQGFSSWQDKSNERLDRGGDLLAQFPSASRQQQETMLKQARTLAREQRRSNPPAAADEYNNMMVQFLDLTVEALKAMRDKDDTTLDRVGDQIDTLGRSSVAVAKEASETCI